MKYLLLFLVLTPQLLLAQRDTIYTTKSGKEVPIELKNRLKRGQRLIYYGDKLIGRENIKKIKTDSGLILVLDGLTEYYDGHGKLSASRVYKNNFKNGISKEYSGGILRESKTFKRGYPNGKQQLFQYGKLNTESFLKPFEERQTKRAFEVNGEDGKRYIELDNTYTLYFENGNKRSVTYYKDGLSTGKSESFFETGEPKGFSKMINDSIQYSEYYEGTELKSTAYRIRKEGLGEVDFLKHGQEILYKNGKVYWFGTFKNGKGEGEFKEYYENGKIKRKSFVQNDKQLDSLREYYDNGQLKREGFYKEIFNWNGSSRIEEVGWFYKYSESGKILFETFYNDLGRMLYSATYDTNGSILDRSFSPGVWHWEIKYYPNGKVKYERNTFFEEHFFINGQSHRFLMERQAINTNYAIKLDLDSEEKIETLLDSTQGRTKEIDYYTSDLSSFDLYHTALKDGLHEVYYKSGQKRLLCNIKDKLLAGEFKLYRPNGSLIYSTFIKNGEEAGNTVRINHLGDTLKHIIREDGNVVYKKEKQLNGILSISRYDSLKSLIYELKTYENGKIQRLYDKLKRTERYWHINGQIASEIYPLGNSDTLLVRSYYENGMLREKYSRVNDLKEGNYYWNFKNGQARIIANYKNNLSNGEYEVYRENGDLWMKGMKINDKKEGFWTVVEDGKVEVRLFKNGIFQVEPPSSKCGCIDTSNKKNSYSQFNALKWRLNYSEYQRYNFSFFRDMDSINYHQLYFANPTYYDQSYQMTLYSFRRISMPFDSKSSIILNACHVNEFVSAFFISAHYNEQKPEDRWLYLNNLRVALEFENSFFDKGAKPLRIQFDTENLKISEAKHIKTEEREVAMCFEDITKGGWTIKEGRGNILPNISLSKNKRNGFDLTQLFPLAYFEEKVNRNNQSYYSPKKILKDSILKQNLIGFYLNKGSGEMLVKGKMIPFSVKFLLLSNQYNGGGFYISSIERKSGNSYNYKTESSTISFTEAELLKGLNLFGFQNTRVHFSEDKNQLKINFYNE